MEAECEVSSTRFALEPSSQKAREHGLHQLAQSFVKYLSSQQFQLPVGHPMAEHSGAEEVGWPPRSKPLASWARVGANPETCEHRGLQASLRPHQPVCSHLGATSIREIARGALLKADRIRSSRRSLWQGLVLWLASQVEEKVFSCSIDLDDYWESLEALLAALGALAEPSPRHSSSLAPSLGDMGSWGSWQPQAKKPRLTEVSKEATGSQMEKGTPAPQCSPQLLLSLSSSSLPAPCADVSAVASPAGGPWVAGHQQDLGDPQVAARVSPEREGWNNGATDSLPQRLPALTPSGSSNKGRQQVGAVALSDEEGRVGREAWGVHQGLKAKFHVGLQLCYLAAMARIQEHHASAAAPQGSARAARRLSQEEHRGMAELKQLAFGLVMFLGADQGRVSARFTLQVLGSLEEESISILTAASQLAADGVIHIPCALLQYVQSPGAAPTLLAPGPSVGSLATRSSADPTPLSSKLLGAHAYGAMQLQGTLVQVCADGPCRAKEESQKRSLCELEPDVEPWKAEKNLCCSVERSSYCA